MNYLVVKPEPDGPCLTLFLREPSEFPCLDLTASSPLQEAVSAAAEPPDRPGGPGQSTARHSQLVPGAPSQAFPAGGLHRPPGQQEAPHLPLLKQSARRDAQSQVVQAAEPQRRRRDDGRRRPEKLTGPAEALRLAVRRVPAGRRGRQEAGTRGT